MKIVIILPYKEKIKNGGAVSIYTKDLIRYSKFKKKITLISSENFKKRKFFKNYNYIKDFCDIYKNKKIDIIEVHNRPEYVKYLVENFPSTKILLSFTMIL